MRIRRKTDQLTMIALFIICAWSFTTMYFLWRRTKKRDVLKRSEFRDWFIYPQWNKLTNSAIRPERINLFVDVTKVEHRDSNDVLKHGRKVIMKSPRKNMIDFGREDLEVEGVDDYIFWYENFINNGHQLPILPRQQKCKKPLHDIAFLKTHYTGSDVITNILNRFGDLNNLNVALPTDGLSTFFWPMRFQWKYIDITLLNGSLPNIIANHARYNNDVMDNILNPNSVYITIIRDPVSQLETTFNNLEFGELLEIEAKEDQLKMFLKDPKLYIQGVIQRHRFKDSLNLIKNGQFFDLGLSTTDYHKKNVIKSTIQELYEKFTLVLVYEYLDESLVMLKRKLCWQIDDILYLRFQHKNHNGKNRKAMSGELSAMIKSWNKADASLYEFFNRTLWEEIRYEGEDFWKELKEFKETLEKIELDCVGEAVNSDQFTLEEIPAEKQSSYSYEASNGDTLPISEKHNIFSKKHREINRKKIRLKDLLAVPYLTNSHRHILNKNPDGEEQGLPFPHKYTSFNDLNISTEETNNIHRNRHAREAEVKSNINVYNERFYQHANTSNIVVGNVTQKDLEIPLKEKTPLLNEYQLNAEGSGKEPRLQVNVNNMLNKQASRWNNYFCKKLLMSEIEYLEYFRKKHANAKVQVAKR